MKSQKQEEGGFSVCNIHLSVYIAFIAYVGKSQRQPV